MTEIAIYSDIDSVTGFGPQAMREALAEAGGGPITIRLNSQGGNVIDGLACLNLMRSYPGEKTVVIDGMALSIASLIACGGDTVQMAENAWMMIHNPHNECAGDGDDLRGMAGLLDGMRDQLATVYSAKSKKPKEEILALMAAETWMTGPQAKEAGFVDEVTASLEVAATFDADRFSRPPTIQPKEPDMAAATVHPRVYGELIYNLRYKR
ncbi:MAG: Clp protease ClpP [Rhodospirillales bacterium]|jgi:ATP-dependent protease ClpP protease subunit|nr:Clp protease ClpP [Rhodospirillales bacterium]